MKKLMELNLFSKGIFVVRAYWGNVVKHNIAPYTPTLYLAHADTHNKQNRKWHSRSITNCYCRACDTLMVIPGAIDNLLYNKSVTCPVCGREHQINNVLITEDSSSPMPLYIKASLIEFKNYIRLRFSYEAVILGEKVYSDFDENIKVIEQFDFHYTEKRVVWEKCINDTKEIREIGFYSDLLNPLQTVLNFIPYSIVDKKGKRMSELMTYLRNYLTEKMQEQGYSRRKMFFYAPKSKMTERNLLYIARKVRFWDESETSDFYKLDSYNLSIAIKKLDLPDLTEQERNLSLLIQKGETYLDAFLETFSLPNNRLVRKNLNYSSVYPLQNALSLNNEVLASTLVPYFSKNHNSITTICSYYKYLAKYYPQKHCSDVLHSNLRTLQDTINLFNMLTKKHLAKFESDKPHFKELHDYLSILVSKQKSNEINYHIPAHIINRLDMQLRNSTCKVLTQYSQILKAGIDLKNCAASYKNRINDNLQLVLITDDNGKAKVLLEIKNQSIVQAKLFNNRQVKTNAEYNLIVKEFALKAQLSIATEDIDMDEKVGESKLATTA